MTAMTASQYREGAMTSEERMVIFASSLGTVFEWYDFYIYGTLAPILAAQFFSGVNPTAAFIFTLLAFAAGFAVRPFGALVFGRLGDIVGRKYTFIITMTLRSRHQYRQVGRSARAGDHMAAGQGQPRTRDRDVPIGRDRGTPT
jgi:MFS family permease